MNDDQRKIYVYDEKERKKKNEKEKFDSNKIPINSVLRELETL